MLCSLLIGAFRGQTGAYNNVPLIHIPTIEDSSIDACRPKVRDLGLASTRWPAMGIVAT